MTNQNNQNIVVYNDGELELKVPVNGETIWLSKSQISDVFETSVDNVGLHLKNIYKENELDEFSTTEDFLVVRQEGKRSVKRTIKHYNFDAIISVGYRVSSIKATKFRQWATSVLKNYIQNGYVINQHKINELRLSSLENDVATISKQLQLDINKYNQQYNNLEVKITKNFHDRFMILDDNNVYYIGASLKDLGNKVFALSKISIDSGDILRRL